MEEPIKPQTISVAPEFESLALSNPPQAVEAPPIGKLAGIIQAQPAFWKPSSNNQSTGNDREGWLQKMHNLLFDLNEAAVLFNHELQRKSLLNAFLFAVGMNQIVEDYLNDPGVLGRATNLLSHLPEPLSKYISIINLRIFRIWMQLQGSIGANRKIISWNKNLSDVVNQLSELVMSQEENDPSSVAHIKDLSEDILSDIHLLPRKLNREIIRLPSCFISFDQQFEDFKHLINNFSEKWPDRNRYLLVIGIRTSGSYLAPLYLTLLQALGYHNARLITIRPGKFSTEQVQKAFHQVISENGLALICDDPPISGGTIHKTAVMLEQAGVSIANIVLLLQLFGDLSSLPASLTKYQSVIIPWQDWNIHQYLDPGSVERVLTEACIEPMRVVKVNPIQIENESEARQHAQSLYEVELIDSKSGTTYSRLVQVKGIGLGYFAEHALAVSSVLSGYSPQLIRVQNGLCYQDLSVKSHLLSLATISGDGKWQESIIEYILERNKKLSVRKDISLQLYGRNAVWEVASNMLGKVYGRGWWPARKAFIDPFVKNVLRAPKPSIIDGDIGLINWYVFDTGETPLVKMHLTERDFSHKDLFSYDPVYDLASLAQEVQGFDQRSEIRQRYEVRSGDIVTLERWMLYQMVRLWDMNRQKSNAPTGIAARLSKVAQEYYSEIYFKDLPNRTEGPLCTLDIDGVLETNRLGFPSLTKSSAKSLRALIQHGYRVLLATGRSIDEVKNRCIAYHLAGGVAEYGAVLYDHASGKTMPLLTEAEQAALTQLRDILSKVPGVQVDPDYQFSVRAYTIDASGKRSGLSDETIARAQADPGSRNQVYAIKGIEQTDFTAIRINKGFGLEQWVAYFDPGSGYEKENAVKEKPIALSVGDGHPDITMFGMSAHAFAPAHARLEENCIMFQVTSKPYQRGFEQAVTKFIGHKPGTCPVCQDPVIQPQTEFMLGLLSVQEGGLMYMAREAIRLYTRRVRKLNVGTE